MADITQTLKLDDIASGDSIIHNLNGPVKLISAIIIIVFTADYCSNNNGNIFTAYLIFIKSIYKRCI